ncbi:MAG: hypothetical protein R6U91_08870 [Bacillota bacterium]
MAVKSDAHFAKDVGRSERAREVLAQAGIAPDQIVNSSLKKFSICLKNGGNG